MAWMQTTVPGGTDTLPYRKRLFNFATAGTAGGKLDADLGILSRTDGDQMVLMLTPPAVKYTHMMPGDWTEVADPKAHGWTVIYTVGSSLSDLGLKAEA